MPSELHDDLVKRAARWLRTSQRCSVVFAEFVTAIPVIPDAVGWRNGGYQCVLVEVKVSRSDFRRDRKKNHWLAPGHVRWYFTPKGLLQPEELPDGWGLAEAHGKRVRKIVEPEVMESNRQSEISMLVSAQRRVQAGHAWDSELDRFEVAHD